MFFATKGKEKEKNPVGRLVGHTNQICISSTKHLNAY